MKYTLLELPPENVDLEEESFVDVATLEELSDNGVEEDVLQRLFLPGKEIGPYRILGYVASGGMGDIYAAERHMDDGRVLGPIALKVITPELRGDWMIEERFKREAAISKAIRSPHVTRVYEFGEDDDEHMFLAMELLKGEELFDRLCVIRKFAERDVAQIFLSVLQGLHIVHESGFIHRDLKPENIYFARARGREVIKILDFGIAKYADAPSDPFLSVVGKIYGTPEYISPEQGLSPDVDPRADLYSVGVMMHECLTGQLPFRGATSYATILMHQTEPPPPLKGVDPAFAKIVFRAMEKKPKDRYQTAAEFSADIRAWYVKHYDDEFSAELRDSQNLPMLPRPRAETPARPGETPADGTPVPNLMPTRRQAARRAKGPTPGRVPNARHAGASSASNEVAAVVHDDADFRARMDGSSRLAMAVSIVGVALIVVAIVWALLF